MTEYVQPGPADEFPDVWGTVTLAKRQWPGRARVTVSRANDWDRPKAPGEHSAKTKLKGTQQAKVGITIEYWESAHHDEIVFDLLATIEPPPGKSKLEAVAISHAVTIMRGVSQVTIDSIEGPVKDDSGMYTLTIQATEERPVSDKLATGTATGAAGESTKCAQLRKSYASYITSGQNAANALVLAAPEDRAALQNAATLAFAAATEIQAQIAANKCPPASSGPSSAPSTVAP